MPPGSPAPGPGPGEAPNSVHHGGGDGVAWTTVNSAEALPGLLTPLSWTFWDERLELALRVAFAGMGVLRRSQVRVPTTVAERFSGVFFGRLACNLDLMRACADRMPGTSGEDLELQLFGAVRPGATSLRSRGRYPVIAAKLPWALASIRRRVNADRRATATWWTAVTTTSTPLGEEQARRLLTEAGSRFQRVLGNHLLSSFLCQAIFAQLKARCAAADFLGLEMRLTSGYQNFEEASLLRDIWAVSREQLSRAQFLARHGYHGFREGDISRPSWRDDPAGLDALIESYRASDDTHAPATAEARQIAERIAAQRQLLEATPRYGRVRTRAVLRLAARHISLREVGKVSFVQAIDVARFASEQLGRSLQIRGALDAPRDVFYLTYHELVSAGPRHPRRLVTERKAVHARYTAMTIPQTWSGKLTLDMVAPTGPRSSTAISGIPVYPGVVEGRAVVVTDPNQDADFEPGDVLVCRFTDPSWTMLMHLAAGLVIDIGGPLSHGAIIARQLGIPTVINTGDGTRALSTGGDLVRVDGGAGTVDVLVRTEATDRARDE